MYRYLLQEVKKKLAEHVSHVKIALMFFVKVSSSIFCEIGDVLKMALIISVLVPYATTGKVSYINSFHVTFVAHGALIPDYQIRITNIVCNRTILTNDVCCYFLMI